MTRRLALALLLLGAVGCGAEIGGDVSASGGALLLTEQEPGHVAGRFSRQGVTVVFDATSGAAGTRLALQAADGRALLVSESRDGRASLEVLGRPVTGEAMGGGDAMALAQLMELPEARQLPWLSYELGALGLTGRAAPAAFALHALGQSVAQAAGIDLPPLLERMSVAYELEAQARGCRDLRGDPNRDGCFGMCGRGCGCWSWVCGDCCTHPGCAAHDRDCRSCGLRNPAACARCASFASFWTGGRC